MNAWARPAASDTITVGGRRLTEVKLFTVAPCTVWSMSVQQTSGSLQLMTATPVANSPTCWRNSMASAVGVPVTVIVLVLLELRGRSHGRGGDRRATGLLGTGILRAGPV